MSYNNLQLVPLLNCFKNIGSADFATLSDSQRSALLRRINRIKSVLSSPIDANLEINQLLRELSLEDSTSLSREMDASYSLNVPGVYFFQVMSVLPSISGISTLASLSSNTHLLTPPARSLKKDMVKFHAHTGISIYEGTSIEVEFIGPEKFPMFSNELAKSISGTFLSLNLTDSPYFVNLYDSYLEPRIRQTDALRAQGDYEVLLKGDERFAGFD
ncbi:hypothetical protein KUA17_15225 [Vibrio parahaemolyticus]|uniref:hypothetical protein n=1 Tax=Vibrio harveyi group TaxID=717610 RepID=UPI001F3D2A90|nr:MULTISPECIES: hypothetical protein [Vibrio harveyi group]MCG0029647.1 hypothetical protein [Vibrio parahaemolyticus]MCS0438237.1 hypothetical protein [Vibrio diabolicus]